MKTVNQTIMNHLGFVINDIDPRQDTNSYQLRKTSDFNLEPSTEHTAEFMDNTQYNPDASIAGLAQQLQIEETAIAELESAVHHIPEGVNALDSETEKIWQAKQATKV